MKENKLIEMQKKVEILGAAMKKTLYRLDALQDFAQGILTSFQVHIGKDQWEKIVEELKNVEERRAAAAAGINKKNIDLDVEQPVEKGN